MHEKLDKRYKDYHMYFFISAMLPCLDSANLPSTSGLMQICPPSEKYGKDNIADMEKTL